MQGDLIPAYLEHAMSKLLFIFIGGGVGASLRYAISLLFLHQHKPLWLGTLTANTVGCFLIGCIYGILLSKSQFLSDHLKLGLTVGFLGGLTTFSTFSWETLTFLKEAKLLAGIGYMQASCLVGLLCAWAGYLVSGRF